MTLISLVKPGYMKQGPFRVLGLRGTSASPFFYCELRNLRCNSKIGNTDFDPDVISSVQADDFKSPEQIKWLEKLANFTGELKEVPDENENASTYATVKEDNAKIVLAYVKAELAKNAFSETSVTAFLSATVKKVVTTKVAQECIIALKKGLSSGKYAGFMDACEVKCQLKTDLTQRAKGLVLTVEEWQVNLDNVTSVSVARSGWGRTTSKKSYILETPVGKKRENQSEFDLWVSKTASKVTAIINLTVAQIPVNYAPLVLGEFAADPQSIENKKKVDAELLKLKNEAIRAWRLDKAGFNLQVFLDAK